MNYYQDSPYDVHSQAVDTKVSAVMKNVYLKMFLALVVTALTAWFVSSTATSSGFNFPLYMAQHRWVYWVLALGEIGLVIWISARLMKMSPAMASLLFYVFAVVNGLTLSVIFLAFSYASIFKTFLITGGVFGAMSAYGYLTNRDLTKFGSFLMMALFGLIIVSVVNIFWANSTLDWIVSGIGVLIFIGLTAWDTQQIKQMAYSYPGMGDGRLATYGALSLYLDFINLFLYLLRFFGSSRD